jgi:hypothetical protein
MFSANSFRNSGDKGGTFEGNKIDAGYDIFVKRRVQRSERIICLFFPYVCELKMERANIDMPRVNY